MSNPLPTYSLTNSQFDDDALVTLHINSTRSLWISMCIKPAALPLEKKTWTGYFPAGLVILTLHHRMHIREEFRGRPTISFHIRVCPILISARPIIYIHMCVRARVYIVMQLGFMFQVLYRSTRIQESCRPTK